MSKVVAVRKKYGRIVQYKLDDGRVLDFEECWNLVNKGLVDNLQNVIRDDGVVAIRSMRDDTTDNNLESLPEF